MPRVSGSRDDNGALAQLGAAIRRVREAAKLSQEALADRAGLDRSHMGKIERGERNVTMLNVLRIAVALDMTAAALMAHAQL